MPCKTIVETRKGEPRLCGEPARSYIITSENYTGLIVAQDLCETHAAKAQREGYQLRDESTDTSYVTRTTRSTHCQS